MRLSELAERIGARLSGDGQVEVTAIASLGEAGAQEVSFISEPRFAKEALGCKAAALIIPEDFTGEVSSAKLFVADVNEAIEQVLTLFLPPADVPEVGVHATACVAASARLGEKVAVGPHVVISAQAAVADGCVISAGCYIGAQVELGRHCFLGPNVVINARCVLGNEVIIHANSTIGTDGFGYRQVEGRHCKIPHIGIVVIEDEVEIGANSCVDRAKFGKTVIGRGTKIDNLVQIAHNVQIGEHCIIVSQTGIAGSSRLGKNVILAGQCGVSDHVNIGDGVMAGAQSGILQDVESGLRIIGIPARPAKKALRELMLIQRLPEIVQEIKQLRKQIEDLGSAKNDS